MATPFEGSKPSIDPPASRRAEIIAAAWRLIAREGLNAATVRGISAELGCTTGVVSHHFRNKRDLTRLACDEVSASVFRRMDNTADSGAPTERLQSLCNGFLPRGEAIDETWAVWISFLAAALHDDDLMQRHSRSCDGARKFIIDLLETFQRDELLSEEVDTAFEADYLFGLLCGLGVNSFITPDSYGPAQLTQFVGTHFDRLLRTFPPSPA
jgi:AcrR family transcriptional regulator